MSWKWLSTATTTKRPVVEGGVVTTTMGRGEKDGVGPAPAIPEHAEAVAPRNDAAAARAKGRQERMPARDIGNPECPVPGRGAGAARDPAWPVGPPAPHVPLGAGWPAACPGTAPPATPGSRRGPGPAPRGIRHERQGRGRRTHPTGRREGPPAARG